jgi:hypothetical protein
MVISVQEMRRFIFMITAIPSRMQRVAIVLFAALVILVAASQAYAQHLFSVQAGCFKEENVALDLLADLRLDAFQCRTEKKEGLTYVLCGTFVSRGGADSLRRSLVQKGYKGAFLVDARHFDVPSAAQGNGTPQRSFKSVQVGSFKSPDNADSVIAELDENEIECRKQKMDGHFKVYCGKIDPDGDTDPILSKIDALGYTSAFVVVLPEVPFFAGPALAQQPVRVKEPRVLKVPEALISKPEPIKPPEPEVPPVEPMEVLEAPEVGINGDIFGKAGGHFHPFISVTSHYLDNIYESDQEKKADVLTVLTGGLWFSAPGVKRLMIEQTSGSLPGGIRKRSILNETERPYQAYFLYKADAERYSKYDSGNFVNHKAEALMSLNGSAGHRLELSDVYLRSHDAKGEEPVKELGEFRSNHLGLSATVALTSKLLLRVDYGQFRIDYEKDIFKHKEHEDRSYSAFAYFRMLPKTSVYVEYTGTEIDYDDIYLLDSEEKDYLLGLQWEVTEKTKGDVKAGFSKREYDSPAREKSSLAKIVGDVEYRFGRKTMIEVEAGRYRKEAGVQSADFVLSEHASMRFINRPTSKIKWSVVARVRKSTYEGVGQNRVDDDVYGSAQLNYKFKRWFYAHTGYSYERRSSSQQGSGYTANSVYLGLLLTF